MEENAPEQHIFKDVENIFSDKIHTFHNAFVDCSLLVGLDEPNTPLDKVKMTKNPKFTLLYYKRIVGGILSNLPLVKIKSFSDHILKSYCAIHYLNNEKDIDDFFYIQNVMNWAGTNQTCFQVWKLHYSSIFEINKHWT